MDFAGSVLSSAVSSSFMPFLKALMPWATSPIRSEILPRPNSRRTTAITTIQCQMLSEPILQLLQSGRQSIRPNLKRKVGLRGVKNKHPPGSKSLSRLRTIATVNQWLWRLFPRSQLTAAAVLFRLDARRQREFQIAGFERLLVLAQRGVIRRRRNGKARRQARIEQTCAPQFLKARQVAQRFKVELRQEGFRG